MHVVAEHGHDFFGLVLAQQAVVDKNAGQLVADRFVDQDRGNGRIDAAGQAADDLACRQPVRGSRNRFFAVGAHRPVAVETSERTKFS